MKLCLTAGLALFAVSGCAHMALHGSEIPENARIIQGVPLYAQADRQCGSASLAAVLNYWQERSGMEGLNPEEISEEVYSSGARGTLGMDLALFAAEKGFLARQYSGGIDDLKANIRKGLPSIILVDYGWSIYQAGHFLVVTGYAENGIIVHSGERRVFIATGELEKIWGKSNFWTLVVQPSG